MKATLAKDSEPKNPYFYTTTTKTSPSKIPGLELRIFFRTWLGSVDR
jgi:hypothetical protein